MVVEWAQTLAWLCVVGQFGETENVIRPLVEEVALEHVTPRGAMMVVADLLRRSAGNLSAAFEALDQGFWEDTARKDQYWRDDEREALADTSQLERKPEWASTGNHNWAKDWTCKKSLYADDYDDPQGLDCCFYTGTNQCPGASEQAVLRRFSTSAAFGVTAADLADVLDGRVLLFLGDSLQHQSFEALRCMLRRYGYKTKKSTEAKLCIQSTCNQAHTVVLENPEDGRVARVRFMFLFGGYGEPLYERDDIDVALQPDVGVVVINMGVHYYNSGTGFGLGQCQKDLSTILQSIDYWRSSSTDSRSKVAIWRGTLPQHFETPDGRFDAFQPGEFRCQAMTAPVTEREVDECFFKHSGVTESDGVYYASVYGAINQRHDAHPGTTSTDLGNRTDCTHFCTFPPVWDIVFERIYVALLHDSLLLAESGHD
jgi:hypothetical protein